jgi:hypothetical protein
MSRNPAARGKTDANQKAIADAIRLLGYPVMDLSHAGNGVEDLLVGLRKTFTVPDDDWLTVCRWWLLVECKVPPVRYKPAQLAWRERAPDWPRITVTSAQDAVDQIRELTR